MTSSPNFVGTAEADVASVISSPQDFTIVVDATAKTLVLSIGIEDADPTDVDSITYDGQALTKVTGASGVEGDLAASLWYIKNPTTGSNTLTITFTGTIDDISILSTEFDGAVDLVNAGVATDFIAATISPTTAGAVSGGRIVSYVSSSSSGTHPWTPQSGQTSRISDGSWGATNALGDESVVAGPAVSHQWDPSVGDGTFVVAGIAEMQDATAGAVDTENLVGGTQQLIIPKSEVVAY